MAPFACIIVAPVKGKLPLGPKLTTNPSSKRMSQFEQIKLVEFIVQIVAYFLFLKVDFNFFEIKVTLMIAVLLATRIV